MSDTPRAAGVPGDDRDNTRVYAGVVAIEILVLAGIWLFQRYFGS
jgi:hypothetical protein